MAEITNFFDPTISPPAAVTQYGYRIQAGQARDEQALLRALALNRFSTQTVPDIIRAKAARGAFWSGAPSRAVARAASQVYEDYGQKEFDLQKILGSLVANQSLATTGMQLPLGGLNL